MRVLKVLSRHLYDRSTFENIEDWRNTSSCLLFHSNNYIVGRQQLYREIELMRRRGRSEKQKASFLPVAYFPFGCQFVAWQPFPAYRRATVHEPALDWLDTYLRSGKRTIDGGSSRVGAIKFTIAEGTYVIERADVIEILSMFIFDINLVDVCGLRRSLHYFN